MVPHEHCDDCASCHHCGGDAAHVGEDVMLIEAVEVIGERDDVAVLRTGRMEPHCARCADWLDLRGRKHRVVVWGAEVAA